MFEIAENSKLDVARDAVIVYTGEYFAVFDLDEYIDIILDLKEKPPERMHRWIKKCRRDKIWAP